MTEKERTRLLAERRRLGRPLHSPPHFEPSDDGSHIVQLNAACFEHRPFIGHSLPRMEEFSSSLLATVEAATEQVIAWCVLPNHYHLLVKTLDIKATISALGKLHGRTSFFWNGEENTRGRKVFFRASDRVIRSRRHFWATVNYIHNNPVRHGYVAKWEQWPWSSAGEYIESVGRNEAARIWLEYPVLDYGDGWDAPSL